MIRQATNWRKIFATYITDEGLISKIHEKSSWSYPQVQSLPMTITSIISVETSHCLVIISHLSSSHPLTPQGKQFPDPARSYYSLMPPPFHPASSPSLDSVVQHYNNSLAHRLNSLASLSLVGLTQQNPNPG